ncbi:MAG: hypothetical protein LPL29_07620 [Alphaproteobacteria bacterium]|nr:hypothetical protein [Alphaproteobacteria bacterium]
MAVVLDVDDVLLDWFGGFRAWLWMEHGISPVGISHPAAWDMSDVYPGLGRAKIVGLIRDFNRSDAFGELTPKPYAEDAIAGLRSFYPGERIVALTSSGLHPKTVKLRAHSLERFDLDELHIVPIGDSKADHLERLFEPGSLYVEDNHMHAADGLHIGYDTLIFDYPHNRNFKDERLMRARCWQGAMQHVRHLKRA